MIRMKAAIFDLDGVIVDTAKYHYLAWKRLAEELGFELTEINNEKLKGVSRMRSLEILLEIGRFNFDDEKKLTLSEKKNRWYVEYINNINETEILKGAREYIVQLRKQGIKIALGSASKNAGTILRNLKISDLFDAIVDGNLVTRAKPDPEIFLLCARKLGRTPEDCVVFEDSEAGIEAAQRAKMITVGIGESQYLKNADVVVKGLYELLQQE